jgi:hypothetical protein
MNHLSPQELSAHLDGATRGAARERVESHLKTCAACRTALAELAAQDAELRPALEHDPGEAYFESFAARVEDRIRAAGLKGAQSRLDENRGFAWLRSPRRLAWVGAVAAVVAGAGIVILSSREIQRPMVNPALEMRAERKTAEGAEPRAREAERRDVLNQAAPASPERQRESAESGVEAGNAPAPVARPQGSSELEAKLDDNAAAKKQAASGAPTSRTIAPGDEARSPAAAGRLQATQRTAAGEDVPLGANESQFAEPPKDREEADLKSAKPRAATPMEAAPSAGAKLEQAPAPGETRLCGKVVDPDGHAIPGAVVTIVDQGRTTTADANGSFCIAGTAGFHELLAMAVGFGTNRLQVRLEGESSETRVTLRPVSVLEQPQAGLARGGRSTETHYNFLGSERDFLGQTPTDSLRAAWLSRRASMLANAAAYDSAAIGWTHYATDATESGRAEARYQIAEARFQAWHLEPIKARATAARKAIDAFLAKAPAGARRDRAETWKRSLPR